MAWKQFLLPIFLEFSKSLLVDILHLKIIHQWADGTFGNANCTKKKERINKARIFNAFATSRTCYAVLLLRSKPFLSCELSQHLQFMYRIPKMANSIEDITGSGANITKGQLISKANFEVFI